MKICREDGEKVHRLMYKDLEVGDVFELDRTPLSGDLLLKQVVGCVWIGRYEPGVPFYGNTRDDERVVRYPNACITLGDPE